jgi:uncharacterized membrane protein
MSTRHERALRRYRERQRRVLYRWIGRILTAGFWTSMALIGLGLLVALIQRESIGDEVAPLEQVVPAVLDLSPQGIVDLGILLLLFTPALYTIVSLYIFMRQRDRIFVIVCCALLAIVFLSVGLGLR